MDMFLMFKGQKEVEKTVNLKQEKDGNRKNNEMLQVCRILPRIINLRMTNRNGMTNQEFTRQKTPKTKCISNEDDLNMQEEER